MWSDCHLLRQSSGEHGCLFFLFLLFFFFLFKQELSLLKGTTLPIGVCVCMFCFILVYGMILLDLT